MKDRRPPTVGIDEADWQEVEEATSRHRAAEKIGAALETATRRSS